MIEQGASAQRISVARKRPLATVKQREKDMGIPFKTEIELARERKKIMGIVTPRGRWHG
jgi:hypothetical protein